jgi:sugar/nucleoside kinase (ribokinase family)
MGFRAGVAMILGDDRFGDDYARYLMGLGVNISNIIRMRGNRTSHSYLFLNADDQHQNFFFPGAADAWKGELRLSRADLYRFALVTVGPLYYNRQFLTQVRQAGVSVVWELKPDIHAYPPELMGEFLEASSYVLMNHIEAEYVLKSLGRTGVEQCLSDRTKAIVVTKGEEGAQVYTASGRKSIPVVPPDPLLDPTGAGDGFTSGFLAGLLKGAEPEVAAQLGAVLATYVLEAMGCQTNLPDWDRAIERYKKHFGEFVVSE